MLLRQDNGIDNVNHAVGAEDVGLYNIRCIDCDSTVVSGNFQGLAIHGFCRLQGDDIGGCDPVSYTHLTLPTNREV